MSIGKNTYGTSVSASLNIKYALDHKKSFSIQGLINSILQEIKDELKIPPEWLEEFCCSKNLVAAYRDLVEGGKPQILICLKCLWTKAQIEQNFVRLLSDKQKTGTILLEDGSRLLWIHRDELPLLCLDQDMMIYRGNIYSMTHSTAASLGMFVEYLRHTS